ncbi:MAG: tyrosine-type recombinase/integrase [Thaumarchaeota archaeon]|nr:tyrosine-type recombinase/integrase [Nitrososphaerota archaeon]
MKVLNRKAYEWRRDHREEVIPQLKVYLEKVGRRGSKKSVENATGGMMDFCSYLEMLPNDALDYLRKNDVYKVLDGYVAWMLKDKFAPNSLRNRLSAVKKFLAINDFELDNAKMRVKVDLPRYHAVTADRVPTPEELRSVLVHTDSRGKTLVTMLASSGMRVGEFLTLRVKDIDLSKNPATVHLRAEVTKDRQQRYCFISDEAATFLKDFLRDRVNNPGDYIFPTSTRGQEHKTGNLPMSYWNADHIFSLALKNAGLAMKDDHGRDTIHIHCLRKFFFTQMLQPLGRDIAEALMGHKLFLDSAYRRYTEDQMREFYLKGMDAVTIMLRKRGMSEDETKKSFRRVILKQVAGYSEEEIDKLDLSSIKDEDLQKMVRERLLGAMANNGSRQKVIRIAEVEKYVMQGWEYVASLPDDRAILKLPT